MKPIILLTLALVGSAFAKPSLQLDKDRIEAGNSFKLQLIFPLQELPENRSDLQFNTANGFTLLSIDSTDQVVRPSADFFEDFFSSHSRRPYKARIYTFNLKAPRKTGRLDAGSIFLTINDEKQQIASNIPINIQQSYSDAALKVSLKPSKTTIYEGEQIYLNLVFHTYEHFAGGLQGMDMSTGNDFIVHRNDLSNIEWKPVEGTRERTSSTKFAWLSPTKSGHLEIPPFKFKYTKVGEPKVVEEKKQMGSMSFTSRTVKQEPEEVETSSAPIKITVKPLPTEGKPADFSGMVGNYSFKADIDKSNLKVGEALTLTITLKGDGTPGTITDPKLPDFSDFRAVPPENNITKKIQGQKVITTKTTHIFLYPKKKGQFTIPDITYSWFNPSKKKYETVTAGPWNIEVEKGDNTVADVFQPQVNNPAGGPPVVQKQEIEDLGSDIRFIHNIKSTLDPQALYKNLWYWIAFLGAIPVYFGLTFAIRQKRRRSKNTALVRKSNANKMLKIRFAKAKEALAKGDGKALYAALENGLIDYLSDLTNEEYKGMTRPQMKDALKAKSLDDKTIETIDSWLEKCAFARFAPVNPSPEEQKQMLKDVETLCGSLKI